MILKSKPLSNVEILKLINDRLIRFGFEGDYILEESDIIEFARAIEKEHGIQ